MRSCAILCATTALAACGAGVAQAQTAGHASAAVQSLDEVVVTARRTEERLQDVPISISVYSQAQLSDRNITTATDLSAYTPSLSANSRYGQENASYAIRGFTQEQGTSPSVAVYFADVVAPRANGGTTAGNGSSVGSFFDLQNVQVLKGPQGTLFGRNTTGGAVLLVPQKPDREFGGYAEASTGNHDLWRLQAAVNVPVNDAVRLRLAFDRQERQGYVNNISGVGPRDFSDIDYLALRGSLVLDLTPDLENYTIASRSDSDTHGLLPRLALCDTAPTAAGARILAPFACAQLASMNARGAGYYDAENGAPNARQHNRQWQVINTTTWRLNDALTVKNIASYAEFWQRQNVALMGDNFFLPNGVPLAYIQLQPFPGSRNVSQKTYTEELQVQGQSFDDRLRWQAGLYYEKSTPLGGFQRTLNTIMISCEDAANYRCADVLSALAGGRPFGSLNISGTTYRFTNAAVYLQSTYKFTDTLSLTGGFRITSDKTTGVGEVVRASFPTPNNPTFACSNIAYFPNTPVVDPKVAEPSACRLERTEKSTKPTWVIDLDYKPNPDVLVYAKYARGYRQGSVNTSNVGFETWGPETVDSYEIGAKTSFNGTVRGNFNIAAFYNELKDQQLMAGAVAIPPFAGAAVIVNSGKSRIAGVEIDGAVTLLDDLTVSFGYAYLDTKLKSFTPPSFPTNIYSAILPNAVVGGELTYAPKNKLTLTTTYQAPLDERFGDLSLSATYTHVDKQIANANSPLGILPATDLLNLNLNWNEMFGRPIDLGLFVTNVTKEKYPVAIGGTWASAGFESLILGEPRMYGARLRVRFGT